MNTEQQNLITLWTNGPQARLTQPLSELLLSTILPDLLKFKPQQNHMPLWDCLEGGRPPVIQIPGMLNP